MAGLLDDVTRFGAVTLYTLYKTNQFNGIFKCDYNTRNELIKPVTKLFRIVFPVGYVVNEVLKCT